MDGSHRTIEEWLTGLDMQDYVPAFADNAVGPDVLPTLTVDDLRDLGISKVGDRRRLMNAIESLRERARPEMAVAAASVDAPHQMDERRHLTIMLCDIAGSTPISTALGPERMRDLVSRFQILCADAVRQFGGYVGPFLGDGVIAYFGYPKTLENDAESALRAGLTILSNIRNDSALERPLDIRIGVASGLVVVSRLEDPQSLHEPAIIGDTANLAQRLQAKAENNSLICGSITRQLAGDLFRFKALGQVPIKGFDAPVSIWEVVGENQFESRYIATRTATIGRMIGRAQERALILERWSTAQQGEGQCVVISGIPGIGKSRLVRSISDAIDLVPERRINFQCSPLFSESPLYPVVRQLETVAGVGHSDPPEVRREKLDAMLALRGAPSDLADDLAPLLMDETGNLPASPESVRTSTFAALVQLLTDVTRSGPVLVVIEDVHWIDPSTRELVQRLLTRISKMPALVIMTCRPEADPRWTHAFDPLLVRLMKLNRSQAAEFLQEVFGDRAISMPIAREIVSRTDGIPLFLEEVCQSLIEKGSLQADQEGRIDPDAALSFVPATLYDTLLSRLDHNQRAKTVAQVASVIGREFRIELLRSIFPGSEDALNTGLGSLLAADIVSPVSDAPTGLFAFKHGLMQQAAYETLLIRDRQALHTKIVERAPTIIPELVRNRPEILARHLTHAGQYERAAETWLSAGQRALGRGAYEESCQLMRSGLSALANQEETASRDILELEIQIILAQALRAARFTGDDEALNACRRARALCIKHGRSEELMRVLRMEFGIQFNRPSIDAAEQLALAFTSTPELQKRTEAAALGQQALGKVAFFRGQFERSRAEMLLSLEDADKLQSPDLITHYQYPAAALVYKAFSELCLGRIQESRQSANEAMASSSGSSQFTHALTLANILILELMHGHSEWSDPILEELRPIALDRGAPFWVDLVGFHDGFRLVEEEDRDVGIKMMQRTLVTFQQNSAEVEVPFYETIVANALAKCGRYSEAKSVIVSARQRVERTKEEWCLSEVLRLQMSLSMRLDDDRAAAVQLLESARRTCQAQGALLWWLRLELTAFELGLTSLEKLRELAAEFDLGASTPDIDAARRLLDDDA